MTGSQQMPLTKLQLPHERLAWTEIIQEKVLPISSSQRRILRRSKHSSPHVYTHQDKGSFW